MSLLRSFPNPLDFLRRKSRNFKEILRCDIQKADNFHGYRLFVSYLSELLKPPPDIRLEYAVADGRLVRHKGEVVGFALDLDVFVF